MVKRIAGWMVAVAMVGYVWMADPSVASEPAVKPQKGLQEARLSIEGMSCNACAGALESQLKEIRGVEKVLVSFEKGEARVWYRGGDEVLRKVKKEIKKSGYRLASVQQPGGMRGMHEMAGMKKTRMDKSQSKEAVSRMLSPAELQKWLQSDKRDFLLVNVHIPYAGEIPGTDLFVPFDKIEENLSRFPENRDKKIVVYCRGGHMSAIAARTLAKLGFTNVYDLSGGMRAWTKSGFSLTRKSQ